MRGEANQRELARRGLSFVFPAWNEEAGLERTVDAAVHAGDDLVDRGVVDAFEVIVVDDGSTDATGPIADGIAANDPRVRAVHHDRNRTLGAAVRTGFAESTGGLVLYTDADLPFDLAEVETAIRLLRREGVGVVAAYRRSRRGEGLRRVVYSYLYNSLVRALVGVPQRDVNFAGKLVTRDVLEAIELRSEGSFIDVELLARAQRHGFGVLQFGVDYLPRSRGVSTLSSFGVIVVMLREMASMLTEVRVPPGQSRHRQSRQVREPRQARGRRPGQR